MADMREFDIVLVGATGFTGDLVAKWITEEAPKDLKWAIAGRSSTKLEKCKSGLQTSSSTRPTPATIIVDSTKYEDCQSLAKRTKVVVTTVGPYARLGENLLRACAESGTHYCDLTGEIPFVKLMMSKYEEAAKKSGSAIICCSGFDSIPVDLTNYAVARYLREKHGSGTKHARTVITKVAGGVSGGTLSSFFTLLDVFSLKDISAAHAPWSLSTKKGSSAQKNVPHVTYDKDLKMYGASWIGDNVDRSVAARSWSLLDYGAKWTTYGYLGFGTWWKAYMYITALYVGTIMIGIPPIRWLLKKLVIQPGSGPSQKQMDEGFLEMKCIGESDDSAHKAVATMNMKNADPGYKGTAALLACVGLTLALDSSKTEVGKRGGGFWTTACLGQALIDRLAEAGITLNVQDL